MRSLAIPSRAGRGGGCAVITGELQDVVQVEEYQAMDFHASATTT